MSYSVKDALITAAQKLADAHRLNQVNRARLDAFVKVVDKYEATETPDITRYQE